MKRIEWEEIRRRICANVNYRIVDNAHLLDATEIFRKLNVHKKVRTSHYQPSGDWSKIRLGG
jgi:hypothetical protein